MSLTDSHSDIAEEDFDRIEDAVMETARGRWFLREFARRQRAAETQRLLEALGRLERAVCGEAAITTEPSARHVAALAERRDRIAEIAWTLRQTGYDGSLCAMLEAEARKLGDLLADVEDSAAPVHLRLIA